jgi:hypothetical protein
MNVTRRWKRFLALGCSHGNMVNPDAEEAVLKFKRNLRPHFVAHLGDAFDLSAFRSGAAGSADEAENPEPDIDEGLKFLRKLEPDVFLCGNHEDRLWNLAHSPKAVVATCAKELIRKVKTSLALTRTKLVPYDYKQFYPLGDYKLMHGVYFNEQAARDHAEAFGNCIFVHTHRIGVAKGRRHDSPTAINAGCLIDVTQASYAKNRRSTLSWANGFCWGEYCDDRLVAWLHEQPQGMKEWRLPA